MGSILRFRAIRSSEMRQSLDPAPFDPVLGGVANILAPCSSVGPRILHHCTIVVSATKLRISYRSGTMPMMPPTDARPARRRRPYAPRMPREQRRTQLLDSALAIIARDGYAGISIDAI